MLSRILFHTHRVVSRDNPAVRPAGSILLQPPLARFYVVKSGADIKIDDLQEQYMIAKDEFEIAVEETSKKSVYARGDRETAREELARLKELYAAATEDSEASVAAEIKKRVGQRVRELEGAVEELNKADLED
ncbi:MAG: hypothetical protein M1840_004698 [Geoglossum simile]|nr:MAG: hypothetical protein M1840_004698 [Geoglossum simile]